MSTVAPHQPVRKVHRKGKDSVSSWPLRDRLAIYACWGAGLILSAIAMLLMGYMFYRGLQYISLELIFSNPAVGSSQADSGGFLSPILGTLILTTIGTLVALPNMLARITNLNRASMSTQ